MAGDDYIMTEEELEDWKNKLGLDEDIQKARQDRGRGYVPMAVIRKTVDKNGVVKAVLAAKEGKRNAEGRLEDKSA